MTSDCQNLTKYMAGTLVSWLVQVRVLLNTKVLLNTMQLLNTMLLLMRTMVSWPV